MVSPSQVDPPPLARIRASLAKERGFGFGCSAQRVRERERDKEFGCSGLGEGDENLGDG